MSQASGSGSASARSSFAVSGRAVRLQLERILAGRTFSRSDRMTRFLRFTVDQTLEGRGDDIKASGSMSARSSGGVSAAPAIGFGSRRNWCWLRTDATSGGRCGGAARRTERQRPRRVQPLAEIRTAVQLDPLSPIINDGLGYVHLLARRYEEALEHYRRVEDLEPLFYKTYTGMGRIYSLLGQYEKAIAMLEKGRSLAGDVPSILGALGQTFGLAGCTREARALLERLQSLAERGYTPSSCFALVHLGLGEKERALQWLEFGCERRDLAVTSIGVHPVYDALRSEPRFVALLRRMGLTGLAAC